MNEDVSKSRISFENLAKEMHPELVFGVTDDATLARHEEADAPAMAVYNNAAGERCTLSIDGDVEEMKASIKRAALPLVVELYAEIHDDLLDVSLMSIHFTTPHPANSSRDDIAKHPPRLHFHRNPNQRLQHTIPIPSPQLSWQNPIQHCPRLPPPRHRRGHAPPSLLITPTTCIRNPLAHSKSPLPHALPRMPIPFRILLSNLNLHPKFPHWAPATNN